MEQKRKSELSNDVLWTFDAVHGTIDIGMIPFPEILPATRLLLTCPAIERLRNIKQLGFVSRSYSAADHSRYSHAVGTMYMMGGMITRIKNGKRGFPDELFQALKRNFDEDFAKNDGEEGYKINHERLNKHLLLAALLQDTGELPFGQATKEVFTASDTTRKAVSSLGFEDISNWKTKDIFTVACTMDFAKQERNREEFDDISLPLFAFLVTGHMIDRVKDCQPLMMLRHMLDGAVDADRLDYVYRDGHHTMGNFGSPSAVIDSLLYYDERGPVFSDPGPVSNLILMRAHLYTNVYLSSPDRFQSVLLLEILNGLFEASFTNKNLERALGKNELKKNLSVNDFLQLDDASLIRRLRRIYAGRKDLDLASRIETALDVFLNHQDDYESRWLAPTHNGTPPDDARLPEDLYYDTFSGKQPVIYQEKSIRIESSKYEETSETIYLENCSGVFDSLTGRTVSPLPDPQGILAFFPEEDKTRLRKDIWEPIRKGLKDGWLYAFLKRLEWNRTHRDTTASPSQLPSDTCHKPGFSGPSIFISFANEDLVQVMRLVAKLYERKRRYVILAGSAPGYGTEPILNSLRHVDQASAFIVVLSTAYVQKYAEPNKTICNELIRIFRRADKGGVAFVQADKVNDPDLVLPWRAFDFQGAPFVGDPISERDDEGLSELVRQVLQQLPNDDREPSV